MRSFFYISTCLFLFLSCGGKEELAPLLVDISISLEPISEVYKAGELKEIKTSSSENIVTENLKLLWINSYGDYIIQANSSNSFDIPATLSRKSGHTKLMLFYGSIIKQEETFYTSPLQASGTLVSYTGPESLILDQIETTMMVSIPVDKYNNPMEENYPITFQSKHPEAPVVKNTERIKNLFSHITLASKNISGKLFLASQSGNSFSKEQEVIIGPGYGKDFSLELIDFHPYADQRQQVRIQTNIIKDGFGNIVTDGTQVNFILSTSDGFKSIFHAYTIFGMASVEIQNPSKPESWVISANVPNAGSSKDLSLNFGASSNQKILPYYFSKNTLVIGPLKGALSQLVTDGTKVALQSKNQTSDQFSENGIVRFNLSDFYPERPDKFEVIINGNTYSVRR